MQNSEEWGLRPLSPVGAPPPGRGHFKSKAGVRDLEDRQLPLTSACVFPSLPGSLPFLTLCSVSLSLCVPGLSLSPDLCFGVPAASPHRHPLRVSGHRHTPCSW